MKKIIVGFMFLSMLTFAHAQVTSTSTVSGVSEGSTGISTTMPGGNMCALPKIKLNFGDGVFGKKKGEVKTLQEYLIMRGHMTGEATGYFGAKTRLAVKKMQKEMGVAQTGYVGDLTLAGMKDRCFPPPVCDYAAPPEGCSYVKGENYNPVSNCGMKLSCKNVTKVEAPANCKQWYDGCNSCGRSEVGGPLMCTMMACLTNTGTPKCNEYFSAATSTEPVMCTMEYRFCPDGSGMYRDAKCGWHPEKCGIKATTTTSTSSGIQTF